LPLPGIDRGGTVLVGVIDEARRQSILRKFKVAELLVHSSNTNAHKFMLLNTEAVALRDESEFPDTFSSGSFRLMPGLSMFCNSHLRSVTAHRLADAILHESIHAIIYRFEASGERLVPRENEESTKIRSP